MYFTKNVTKDLKELISQKKFGKSKFLDFTHCGVLLYAWGFTLISNNDGVRLFVNNLIHIFVQVNEKIYIYSKPRPLTYFLL